MRRALWTVCLVLLAAPLAARGQSCDAGGFPVTVSPIGDARVDSAFLAEATRAVAHRWVTPSRQRESLGSWRRVRARVLPTIPRWADDWRPNATHRASAVLVLRRRGRASIGALSPASGDRLFDRSIESIVGDPMPASPVLPEIPQSVASDTLALRLDFGVEPEGDSPGTIRFAAQQEPVNVVQGSLVVNYQERRSVSVGRGTQSAVAVMEGIKLSIKYDIGADHLIDPRSLQVLETNDRDFARAVELGLLQARFQAARTNCVPVGITVVQQVTGGQR